MTILVTITNSDDPTSLNHGIIEVVGGSGDKHILAPGKSATTHVWTSTQITIKEMDIPKHQVAYGALPPGARNP